MELGERIGSMARVVRCDASARKTVCRRLLVTAAMTLFFVGLLAALRLSIFVPLALFVATLVGIGGVQSALFGRSALPVLPATSPTPWGTRLRRQTAPLLRSGRDVVARRGRGFLVKARFQTRRLVAIVASAARRAGTACETAVNRPRQVVLAESLRLRAALRSRQAPRDLDLRRGEAFRLNAQGSQFRRDGFYARSAERHRAALTILREFGDRRDEALTLNNLALAIERSGDGGTAVAHFEEAVGILHELRDDESEGQVIANLGLAQRRCGRRDDSANSFQTALEKLSPDSSAYRALEAELRRAS